MQKIVPSRRRGDEVGESEATNTEGVPPSNSTLEVMRQFFSETKINLNLEDCVFMTLHPYKKHKNFEKYQNISKISDILRRKMRAFAIVKEKNQIKGHHHYHVLGYLAKDQILNINGIKIWIDKVGSITHEMAPFTSVKEIMANYTPEDDGEFIAYKREIQGREGHMYARTYLKAKYSMDEQIEFILRYICKTKPESLYFDYNICR